MLKKGILILILLAALMAFVVTAPAEIQESNCEVPAEYNGYICIQGDKGVTIYKAEDLTAIFGAAPVEDNGALKIKYKDSRNRVRDFGTVSGKIEKAAENTIGLTKITAPSTSLANYLSPESSEKGINVKGVKFAINASKRTEDKFGFILVTDIAFQIDESTERDIGLDEKAVACKGQCKISAEMSPSEIVFDIKNGTLLFKEDVTKFMRGEQISLPSVNLLELSRLKILPTVEGSEEPVLAVSAYSGGSTFASVFDTIKFESGQEVELSHSKMHDIGRNRFIGNEIFNSINLK
ncbi:MAG: hypothetical protein V1734_04855, partial [Nanoarchaeota archaeon]